MKKKFNMDNFIGKVDDYIDNNQNWFLVGNENLVQLSKNNDNHFIARTNSKDYDTAIMNFLNDDELEFTDWKELDNEQLKDLLYKNLHSVETYAKEFEYFN